MKQRQDSASGTGRSAWGNAGGVSPDQGGHWNGHFAERSNSDGEARGETICIVPADKCGLVIGKGIVISVSVVFKYIMKHIPGAVIIVTT